MRLGVGAAGAGARRAADPAGAIRRRPGDGRAGLSPDGTKLVYLTTVSGERYVAVRELQKTSQPHPVLHGTGGSYEVVACNFKTNARLLCRFRGVEHDYGVPYPASRMVVLDSDGSHMKVLFQSQAWAASTVANVQMQDRIIHWLPDDPEHVLLQMADEDSVFPSVYTLNVGSGALRTVVGRREPVLDWIADRDGVVRFGYGYRRDEAVYIARNSAKDEWRTLEKFKRFEGAQLLAAGLRAAAQPAVRAVLAAKARGGLADGPQREQ